MMTLPAVTRKYPFHTPRASILKALPKIPDRYGEFIGKAGLRYRSIWATDDHVCRSLYWFGDFDPWINDAIRRLATPGSVAIDIGANIGATALILAASIGEHGRLFCFEPFPKNAAMLRDNIEANNFYWASVEQVALSDSKGQLRMASPLGQAGMTRVVSSESVEDVVVQATTFDDWFETKNIDRISVCKIDVEGHEQNVLSGLRKSLPHVDAVIFERHDSSKKDPIISFFETAGYQIYRIEKSFTKSIFIPLSESSQARPTSDFIAVRPHAAKLIV